MHYHAGAWEREKIKIPPVVGMTGGVVGMTGGHRDDRELNMRGPYTCYQRLKFNNYITPGIHDALFAVADY